MKNRVQINRPRAVLRGLNAGLPFLLPALLFLLFSTPPAGAGVETWVSNPTTGNWNISANWSPHVIPNSSTDTANFATSSKTAVALSASVQVNEIAYQPGGSAFTITVPAGLLLFLSGGGIVNKSGQTQNFVTGVKSSGTIGTINFGGNATAFASNVFTNLGGAFSEGTGGALNFYDSSRAGTCIINNGPPTVPDAFGGITTFYSNSQASSCTLNNIGGATYFFENSTADQATINNVVPSGDDSIPGFTYFTDATAGNATFNNNGGTIHGKSGGYTEFNSFATAGNGIFINQPGAVPGARGGFVLFAGDSTAGNGTFTDSGSNLVSSGGKTVFSDSSTAGNASFSNIGGAADSAGGGRMEFGGQSTAASSTLTAEGSSFNEADGGGIIFGETADAGSATITVTGGTGGGGGFLDFLDDSTGGTCRINVNGSGLVGIGSHDAPGLTIGSLEGSGRVSIIRSNLNVGSNNLSTTFSGVITDNGSVTKIGIGTFTLSSANTYTGGTIVSAGTLLVTNTTGSATGTALVAVNGGTLGGTGRLISKVIVGTPQTSATLAPGIGSEPGTLTLTKALTFKANGIYDVQLQSTAPAAADGVVARGVKIIGGATMSLSDLGHRHLAAGKVFTLIKNTSPNPISGTFDNVADGAILTIGSNSYQASYEGGDGNDLTLTVMP